MALGPLPELERREEVLVALVGLTEEDYARNRNRVGLITTKYLYYIKRRTLGQYWELKKVRLDRVTGIYHRRRRAFGAVLGGLLMIAGGAALLYFSMTRAITGLGKAALAPVLIAGGGALMRGFRQHVIEFHTVDGTLIWTGSGDAASISRAVNEVFEARGIRPAGESRAGT